MSYTSKVNIALILIQGNMPMLSVDCYSGSLIAPKSFENDIYVHFRKI